MEITDINITLILVISICYSLSSLALQKYRAETNKVPPFHESCVAAILGIAIGAFLKFALKKGISFDQNIFFYLILPPIVFSAGYSLKKKKFFRYFHYITLFGIVGTIINFFVLSLCSYYFVRYFPSLGIGELSWIECMILASILAANDEISAMSLIKLREYPRLGGMIFGEGVLNDALSIVLFRTLFSRYYSSSVSVANELSMAKLAVDVLFQLFSSIALGTFCGLVNARFMMVFQFSRQHPIHQTSLVLLTGYIAYAIAESFDISGILTLFVTAVTLSHYSWHSLSKTSKLTTKIMFVSLSDLAEGLSFAYVGLSLWNSSFGDIHIVFALYVLVVMIISRLLTVISLCSAINSFTAIHGLIKSSSEQLPLTRTNSPPESESSFSLLEQLAFVVGGSVRGCLCWAQVLQLKGLNVLVNTVLIVVLVTTIGCGFLFPVMLPKLLKPPKLSSSIRLSLETKKKLGVKRRESYRSIEDESTYSMHMDESDEDEKLNHTPLKPINPILNTADAKGPYETYFDLVSSPEPYQGSTSPLMTSISLSPDSTSHDMQKMATNSDVQPSVKISRLYALWIRIDELYLKPYFGGSKTDRLRSGILETTKELKTIEMLSPIKKVSVVLHKQNDERDEDDYSEDNYYDNDIR